ncbi:MAG TPA: SDR family NAD(P)-dependent oxidoreductase [Acidimicrobiia bacterium]|nr:SDR family NAD(P)-dependent oxidoreductase [Acidimicrobiia bacterium]
MTGVPAWSEPRTAIVTGGGSGIGAAISRRLAVEGAAVAVFDRDSGGAKATAVAIERAGGRALPVTVDISDRPAIDRAVAQVRAELGAATILVNNAAISPFKRFLDIERSELDAVIAVNLIGTFECCQAVVPDMLEAGWGRIVNIASSSAQTGSARQTHYAATKGAVIAFTRSLALELGPKGITVNAVPPSFVDTPSLRAADADGSLDIDAFARMIPVRRVGTADDVAAMCAYLVRDDASYVTGQVLGVNGGRVTT